MTSSQSYPLPSALASMFHPSKLNTGQCLAEQYLARISCATKLTKQIPEPDPSPRPHMRLAAMEEVQAKILNQSKEQHGVQKQALTITSSRPAAQDWTSEVGEEATWSSILSDTLEAEASYEPLQSRHEHKSASSPPPAPLPMMTETLAGLHFELDHRQKICLRIERQIEACSKEIRSRPSKDKKIEKEHEKRITGLLKPVHDEMQRNADAKKRKDAQTAEEAEVEDMRTIYLQYDRESSGAPTAKVVDAFFVVIANTEHHLKKAEEANKVAKKREAKLEGKLYKARCATLEMRDEIEDVENGEFAKEAMEPAVEESRFEGHEEGKRKPKRGKGVRDRQQGIGDGGDEKIGRRRRKRK